jgi:YVTN family beta-propeller protein
MPGRSEYDDVPQEDPMTAYSTGWFGRAARPTSFVAGAMLAWSVTGQPQPAASPAVPAATLIVLNKAEASVSLLDAASGEEMSRIDVGVGPHEVAVSPDRRTAVVCNYGEQQPGDTLSVIDLPSRKVTSTLALDGYHRPHGIVFLNDGTHVLVTAEQEQALLKVDVKTGGVVAYPTGGQNASHMVVVATDQNRAFVANIASGTVSVIDLVGGAEPVIIAAGAGTEAIDLSPDGRELWVGNREAHTLSIIDTATLKVAQTVECPTMPIRLKFTPDGKHSVVSCATSGDLVVFDAGTRQELHRISLKEDGGPAPVPIGIVIAADGARAFVACSGANKVAVVDTSDWSISARLVAGKVPDGLGYAARGPTAAAPK